MTGERPPATGPGHEIRRNVDESLDEVVGWAFVHLEQISATHWWLGLDTEDGRFLHVNFHAKGKVTARVEDEGASDLWARRFRAHAAALEAQRDEAYRRGGEFVDRIQALEAQVFQSGLLVGRLEKVVEAARRLTFDSFGAAMTRPEWWKALKAALADLDATR